MGYPSRKRRKALQITYHWRNGHRNVTLAPHLRGIFIRDTLEFFEFLQILIFQDGVRDHNTKSRLEA